jgi:hypothetical protein
MIEMPSNRSKKLRGTVSLIPVKNISPDVFGVNV